MLPGFSSAMRGSAAGINSATTAAVISMILQMFFIDVFLYTELIICLLKSIFSRLVKNIQIQGARNHEE
jgi:hypothetical protein